MDARVSEGPQIEVLARRPPDLAPRSQRPASRGVRLAVHEGGPSTVYPLRPTAAHSQPAPAAQPPATACRTVALPAGGDSAGGLAPAAWRREASRAEAARRQGGHSRTFDLPSPRSDAGGHSMQPGALEEELRALRRGLLDARRELRSLQVEDIAGLCSDIAGMRMGVAAGGEFAERADAASDRHLERLAAAVVDRLGGKEFSRPPPPPTADVCAQVHELKAAVDRISDRLEVVAMPPSPRGEEALVAALRVGSAKLETCVAAVQGDFQEARSRMLADLREVGEGIKRDVVRAVSIDIGSCRRSIEDDLTPAKQNNCRAILGRLDEIASALQKQPTVWKLEAAAAPCACSLQQSLAELQAGMQLCQAGVCEVAALQRASAAETAASLEAAWGGVDAGIVSLAEKVGSGMAATLEVARAIATRVSALPDHFADPDSVEEARRHSEELLRHRAADASVASALSAATTQLAAQVSRLSAQESAFDVKATEWRASVDGLAQELRGALGQFRDWQRISTALSDFVQAASQGPELAAMLKDVASMREELGQGQARLRSDVAALREDLGSGQAGLGRELAALREEGGGRHADLRASLRSLAGDVQSSGKTLAATTVEALQEHVAPCARALGEVSESLQETKRASAGFFKTVQESLDRQKADLAELKDGMHESARAKTATDSHSLMQAVLEISRSLDQRLDLSPLQRSLGDLRTFSEHAATKAEAAAREHAVQLKGMREQRPLVDVSPAVAAVAGLRELLEARQAETKVSIESIRRHVEVETGALVEAIRREVEGLRDADKRRGEAVVERLQDLAEREERGRAESLARVKELAERAERGREEVSGKFQEFAEKAERGREAALDKLQELADRAERGREECLARVQDMSQRGDRGREASLGRVQELAERVERGREALLGRVQDFAEKAEKDREEALGKVLDSAARADRGREVLLGKVSELAGTVEHFRDESSQKMLALPQIQEATERAQEASAKASSQLLDSVQDVRADIAGHFTSLGSTYIDSFGRVLLVAVDTQKTLQQLKESLAAKRSPVLPQKPKQSEPPVARCKFIAGPESHSARQPAFDEPPAKVCFVKP